MALSIKQEPYPMPFEENKIYFVTVSRYRTRHEAELLWSFGHSKGVSGIFGCWGMWAHCLHVTRFYPPTKPSGTTVGSLAGEKLRRVKENQNWVCAPPGSLFVVFFPVYSGCGNPAWRKNGFSSAACASRKGCDSHRRRDEPPCGNTLQFAFIEAKGRQN